MPSNSEKLIIAYDGEALNDGTMDVKELAPALLAIGDLINECNKVLNGKEEKIQIKVKADFRKGSFQTTIVIVKSLLDQLTLTSGSAFELKDIIELIGFYGGGLILLIKAVQGRIIKKAKQKEDGNIELIFEDNSSPVSANINVYNIYTNVLVQDAINRMVKPLKQDGISGFYTSLDGTHLTNIAKNEVDYFNAPNITAQEKEDELISEFEYIGAFNVVTAQFEDGYKWRLSNGQDKISAALTDSEFSKKIEKDDVSISKEDILKARIKTAQWKKPDGSLRTENEIVEVLEHIKADKYDQLQIPFEV